MNPTATTLSRRGRTSSLFLALLLALTSFALAAASPAFASHNDDDAPVIATIDPESGPSDTYITIEGEGFTSDDEVTFGDLAIQHDVYGDDKIGFYVPTIEVGQYEIVVENDAGSTSFCCFNVTEEDVGDEPEASDEPEPQTQEPTSKDVSNDASCKESGMNVQCNEFGTIKMKSQQEIRGEPVQSEIIVELDTNFADQGARQIMFSVRNVSTFMGDSPVELALDSVTANGEEVYTSRIDQQSPSELNIWVDVLDTPVGTPITILVDVGVSDRGLFHLETLAMPFDRGYDTVTNAEGEPMSLYSYTVLGVNEETNGLDAGNPISRLTPAPGFVTLVAAIGLLGVALRRRNTA